MSSKVSRVCRVCKKIFCCSECRKRHETKKHTHRQLNCPFCSAQKLLLQRFEDKSLLCHIAINHLPLYCCLCGKTFEKIDDLESFGVCKWYRSQHHHSLLQAEKPLIGTPPSEIGTGTESSLEYGNNFNLTSPPELCRNTSTPVISGQKGDFIFKTPSVPNFTLKTPKTNSAASSKDQILSYFQASQLKDSNSDSNFVSFSPSVFPQKQTPFRSVAFSRPGKGDHGPRNNSGRVLNVTKEQSQNNEKEKSMTNDNYRVEDMELTGIEDPPLPDSQGLEVIPVKPERRSDSLKKVRFSDQYQSEPGSSASSTFSTTENDEYFEARDTMSVTNDSIENSQMKIYRDNERNAEKENRSPEVKNVILNQQSSGSSRVIMMVVVENSSTNSLTTSDLAPLIDSSLKKLGQVTSPSNSPSTSNISDVGSPTCSTNSYASMDSCYSASSYERFMTASSMNSPSTLDRRGSNSSTDSAGSSGSGGILSAVANVVRTVMKNFSGAVTKEEIPQREIIGARSSTVETSQLLTSLISFESQRSGKRPRDTTESPPSSSTAVAPLVSQPEPKSPLAKRQRGWYRIKAREPIARMRSTQIRSPRGVSSETQVFSQGSLSVGDTVLPLPARAHQSTQTDN